MEDNLEQLKKIPQIVEAERLHLTEEIKILEGRITKLENNLRRK